MNKFQELFDLDVSAHIDKRKQGKTELSYLSWAWAWAKVNEVDENASYEIKMFPDKDGLLKPYIFDPVLGYMVMTSVTMFEDTKVMWLPVMDGANKAMLDHSYQYKTKYEVKTVEPASMFDINKTLMRCLVKNIAMFGLGLKLYAGEDLPVPVEEQSVKIEEKLSKEEEEKVFQCKTLDSLGDACRDLLNSKGESYAKVITAAYNKRKAEIIKLEKEAKANGDLQL